MKQLYPIIKYPADRKRHRHTYKFYFNYLRWYRQFLERLTLAGYKDKWNLFEFPIDSYKQLRQLLN